MLNNWRAGAPWISESVFASECVNNQVAAKGNATGSFDIWDGSSDQNTTTSVDQCPRGSAGGSVDGVAPFAPGLPSRKVGSAIGKVYEIDPLRDPRWEELIQKHSQGSVFHSTSWLRVLHKVYGYEPFAITTCAPGIPLINAVVFCDIKSWLTGRRFVSLPFSDHCEPLVDRSDELDDMLLYLKQNFNKERWKYVEIRPVSQEPSGHTRFGRGVTYCFHRLDLCRSAQGLFCNFHKDCVQRKIRRAERERLRYEEGASEDLLRHFYKLFVLTRRRQYLPPQPLSWFRGLIASFGNNLKIRVAYKDQRPVASMLTLAHKTTMTYKYGCSDAAFNNLGGTALLFWNAILDAKDNDFEELDMGRSDTDNLGLIAFKEHWGAVGTQLTYWTYPQGPPSLPSVWRRSLAKPIVSIAPNFALKIMGKVLYRHIG